MVKKVAIGSKYKTLPASVLEKRGIECILCPANPAVDERISSHADLSVLHLGETCFILAEYLQNTPFCKALREMGAEIVFAQREQGREYPLDASLCALNIGGRFFHNLRVSDGALLSRFEVIHTAQGYAKCAVCPVDARSAITADTGMARVLKESGIEVLLLEPGQVMLEGFGEGFIGGAAFKLSPRELAITGHLRSEGETRRVETFLERCGVKAVYLTDEVAFDIGSAILLC